MSELTFTITNLNCDACVKLSTKTLSKLPGVTEATVELSTGIVRVTSDEPLNPNDVVEALKAKGYNTAF